MYTLTRQKVVDVILRTICLFCTPPGEDIDMVRSESIDAVVTTLVLCSVDDMAKVISQVKRVLVPVSMLPGLVGGDLGVMVDIAL